MTHSVQGITLRTTRHNGYLVLRYFHDLRADQRAEADFAYRDGRHIAEQLGPDDRSGAFTRHREYAADLSKFLTPHLKRRTEKRATH